MRHLVCDPGAETLGVHILTFFAALRDIETAPILEKYHLAGIGRDDWAATSRFIDALNELAGSADFRAALVATGMAIGASVLAPGGSSQLGEVLMGWNAGYQGLHRGADVGQIACEKRADTYFKLTLTDLYPDDLSYGLVYGYARRFLPLGTTYMIAYDLETRPRDRGGESGQTVIHVKWE